MTRNGPEIVILKYGSIFNASDVSASQKQGGDFAKFCGFLRIYELYVRQLLAYLLDISHFGLHCKQNEQTCLSDSHSYL